MKFFFPSENISIEADSQEIAEKILKWIIKAKKIEQKLNS
jgi:ribonuclease HI